MRHIENVPLIGEATFGRDGAMFESLLGFVAQLSLVLWSLVLFTVVIRFVGIRIYRRGTARRALVETVGASAAVPATGQLTDAVTNPRFDEVLQPARVSATVAASVKVPHRASRNWRTDSRTAARVPAINYTKV